MIVVSERKSATVGVQFKPVKSNLDRIKQIDGAHFDGEKTWIIPLSAMAEFEDLFRGEIIYKTPRHKLLGIAPPPPPGMYRKIPDIEPLGLKMKLYDYQRFGANFLACIAGGTGHAILTDAVGTGKTVQAISGGRILEQQGKVRKTMVFCKASLKFQWLRDGIHKFTSESGHVIDGDRKKRAAQYEAFRSDAGAKYILVNYELLLHDYDELERVVRECGIDLIIADEAHKITNHKAKMNNALKRLVQPRKKPVYAGVPFVFYLTATPMASRIEQLFGIFQIRRPDFFGKFADFSREYLKWMFNGRNQDLVGYKNLDQLRQKVFPYMLRRTSAEVDMELPEVVPVTRKVEMTKLQKRLDKQALQDMAGMEEKYIKALKRNAPAEELEALKGAMQGRMYVRKAISNAPRLLAMSTSETIRERYGIPAEADSEFEKSGKLDEIKDLVQEIAIDAGDKMIIFTELETMTRVLQEAFTEMGVDSVTYTGKMNAQAKDDQITRFREEPDVKLLIATDAAAEGLNLQFCRYIVHYDLPWNPDRVTQRDGRIRRGGSEHKSVTVFTLHSKDSIDDAIVAALESKQNLFNYMVENAEETTDALRKVMYKK